MDGSDQPGDVMSCLFQGDDGSDTSYVNFVRSYHGSSSRSSLTNTSKPQQAWEGKFGHYYSPYPAANP